MAKVCWWHLCYQQGRTQSGPTSPHQQPGPTHTVHSRTNTTRLTTIPGHPCHHRTRQHLQHHSLQEAHPDNTFSTTVYRKPTHTDQYLHWDSNHHITAKQSVYNTLAHRAKIVSSTQDKMDRELQHIRTALQHCQFQEWALNQWQHKFTHPNKPNTTTTNNNNNNSPANNKKNITSAVPYMPNTGEKFRKLCKKTGIQVHFKGTNTLRLALQNPKDKDPKTNQTGIIYHYQCCQINCPSAYIGESGRSLGERVKEHFKSPSPIHLHSTTTGHPVDPEQFNIVQKEVNSHSRTITEAMFICVWDPTLNRNLGKYQLHHIWDHLHQASPTLKCKPSSHPTTPTPTYWFPHTIPLTVHIGRRHILFYGKYTHLSKTHPLYP